jgi:O-antigen ligase
MLIWGIPLPGSGDDPTEGSLVDRMFYAVLALIGLRILSRRGFSWQKLVRANPWLSVLFVLMAASICWSSFPYVSFKRYIKVVGSLVMALVILTSPKPTESLFMVIRRSLFVHLPLSIVCIRYYREIGISFDWSGTGISWQGLSTSKNVLGQVAMLGVVYFVSELSRNWKTSGWKNINTIYLAMALYLIKGSDQAVSMTSVSVCVFALFIYSICRIQRTHLHKLKVWLKVLFTLTIALVALIVVHGLVFFSADSILGQLIAMVGRDITITDRTYIWHDVYAAASGNPILGVGFGGFWIGRLANIPWNENMTWVLAQAHSGYVDTFLQLGVLGWFALSGLIFSSFSRLLQSLDDEFELASFRITVFITVLFVNMTETTYLRGDHHLWLMLLLCICFVPKPSQSFASPSTSAAS